GFHLFLQLPVVFDLLLLGEALLLGHDGLQLLLSLCAVAVIEVADAGRVGRVFRVQLVPVRFRLVSVLQQFGERLEQLRVLRTLYLHGAVVLFEGPAALGQFLRLAGVVLLAEIALLELLERDRGAVDLDGRGLIARVGLVGAVLLFLGLDPLVLRAGLVHRLVGLLEGIVGLLALGLLGLARFILQRRISALGPGVAVFGVQECEDLFRRVAGASPSIRGGAGSAHRLPPFWFRLTPAGCQADNPARF